MSPGSDNNRAESREAPGPVISDQAAARAALSGVISDAGKLRIRISKVRSQYGKGMTELREHNDPRFAQLVNEITEISAILRGEPSTTV